MSLATASLEWVSGGDGLRVVDEKGPSGKRLSSTGHGFGHVQNDPQVFLGLGREKDRLAAPLHQDLCVSDVVKPRRDVPGKPEGADEVDVGKGVADPGAPTHVLLHRVADLPGLHVHGPGKVRSGAEVASTPPELHGRRAVPVEDHHVGRGRRDGLLHQMGRDPDGLSVRDPCSVSGQELHRLLVKDLDADLLEHPECGMVKALYLIRLQQPEGGVCSVGWFPCP